MDTEKKRRTIINVVYYAMIIAIFYLLLKYAFWLFFPIVFSFFIALVLQKPVRAISNKTPIKKSLASVICVLFLIIVIGGIIFLIGASLVSYLKEFAEYIKGLFSNIDSLLHNAESWMLSAAGKFPKSISRLLTANITDIFSRLGSGGAAEATKEAAGAAQSGGISFDLSTITSWLTTPLSSVVSTAKQIPSLLLNTLITIIMSCFLTADFDMVSDFLTAQLSEKRQKDFKRAKYLLKTSFLKILKAYAMIILITFVEMLIGLTVLKLIGAYKSNYVVIIAAVTALVDIFPVLGTGTIIFPWAIYSLIVGNYGLAIGLIIVYAVISVLRQIIEPRLVAGQLGLPPFMTIIGMFLGLKLFGVLGMLIMPILIIMLKLLNDEGIIHLWKTTEKAAVPAENTSAESSAEEKPAEEDGKKDSAE